MPLHCELCPLNTRPHLLGGDGDIETAQYILVGEAPGAIEIVQQKPFVGRSGQLLRQTLTTIKTDIIQYCYFTNVCLCRPSGNETPSKQAIEACIPRLETELHSINNRKVIILLGGTALSATLSNSKVTISSVHGIPIWSDEYSCYIVPTFHPAGVLRNPLLFRDFSDDLVFALTEVPSQKVSPVRIPKIHQCTTVDKIKLAIKYLKYFTQATPLVCDIETTGLNPRIDKILSVMILADLENAWVFPSTALAELRNFLEDSSVIWAGHNASQFDAEFFKAQYNINWFPKFDTLLSHYTLDERQEGHSLKALAQKYFFAEDYGQEMKSAMKANTLDQVDRMKLYSYQALDCYYTHKLMISLSNQMKEEEVLKVHDDILIPLSHTFRDIELKGVKVDVQYLHSLQHELEVELAERLSKLQEVAQTYEMNSFNPNSPLQVRRLLYDHMKLPGPRQTDHTTLSVLNSDVVTQILEYRFKSKLLNTYIEGLLEHRDENDRVHADFILFGTQTGRLSCHNPNLQNIPVLTGPIIKKAFIPSSDEWYIVNADFSQLELRVAAWYSKDEKLIQAYKDGKDLHRTIAAELFEIPEDEVTYKQRYTAKYVDFGILYGRGARSLTGGWSNGKNLTPDERELVDKWTIQTAQHYIDRLFQQFPGLAIWIQTQKKFVLEHHYSITPLGRKRRFPLISSDNQAEVLRQAVNAPIQSLASDICQLSLIKLHQVLNPQEAFIVSTVHDSIMLEVHRDALEKVAPIIKQIMETYPSQLEPRVPLKVDLEYGINWGELQPYEKK